MATPPSPARPSNFRLFRFLRLAMLLLASVLLHLIFLDWSSGQLRALSFTGGEKVVTAELRTIAPALPAAARTETAPAAEAPAVVSHPPAPVRKPRPKPRRRPPPPAQPPPPAPAAETIALEEPATSGVESAAAATPDEPAAQPASEEPPQAPTESPSQQPTDQPAEQTALAAAPDQELGKEQPPQQYKTSPPPSAELKYDVMATQKGYNYYGSGTINWEVQGNVYAVRGEATAIFFSVLNFKSEGLIDAWGVAPVLYAEKRFRKPETNTHFNRERNTISFSASTKTYPWRGGEQDRGSVVWQLAAIGRGGSNAFAAGSEIDLFVAGARDGELWRINVIGEEQVEVGTGKLNAWHVVRVPRPGSHDHKLDLWFAPEQEWYPVKLRYTEVNGDFLEMSLSNTDLVSAR